MKLLAVKCTPGYQLSGDTGVFTAPPESAYGAPMQVGALWQHRGRNAHVINVQTVITDVPDHRSALSLVRRP